MKAAVTELFAQAKNREMCYVAIEHNTKYLAMLAEKADREKEIAIDKVFTQTEDLKRYQEENDEMTKKIKMLAKDAEALVLERSRVTMLTFDLSKVKENLENIQTSYKEASRRLKKADSDVVSLTIARDLYKEKSEELELSFQKCKIDLKEYKHKETLASEINAEF